MKMNIFGKDADFDQLAIAVDNPEFVMRVIGGNFWTKDHVKSNVRTRGPIEFNLFYNYEQDIPFKELELIQFLSNNNFHSAVNKSISPLGLYAASLYKKLSILDTVFISHIGIHCTDTESKEWILHFKQFDIWPIHEDTSYSHTNPAIAGKRTYHNIIFGSRKTLGFDFKACIRIDNDNC